MRHSFGQWRPPCGSKPFFVQIWRYTVQQDDIGLMHYAISKVRIPQSDHNKYLSVIVGLQLGWSCCPDPRPAHPAHRGGPGRHLQLWQVPAGRSGTRRRALRLGQGLLKDDRAAGVTLSGIEYYSLTRPSREIWGEIKAPHADKVRFGWWIGGNKFRQMRVAPSPFWRINCLLGNALAKRCAPPPPTYPVRTGNISHNISHILYHI